jgi:hemin uptake protein HemP
MVSEQQFGGRLPGGEPEASPSAASAPPRRVGIEEILGSGREAIIDFHGASYRLRITRNQRLILTK